MYNLPNHVPVVMSFSCADPSGGSGIQADIEALGSMGCHCAPITTTVTVQDTAGCNKATALPAQLIVEQARAILEDMPVAAIKIGMLGTIANVRALHTLLKDYPNLPVVLDPVLSTEASRCQINQEMCEATIALLLPYTTICTPNSAEAKALSLQADSLDACAQEIMGHGAEYVLLTGASTKEYKIINSLYGNYRRLESFHWDRLPNEYHGSGCTLSASLAGLLAQGLTPISAVHQAQEYTYECLKQAYRIGMGKPLINRLFWARETATEDNKRA